MTNRSAGRPPADLNLMPLAEIARREGLSLIGVQKILQRSFRKLEDAGEYAEFIQLAQIAQHAKPGDFHPVIQCGSIECRPDKWAFNA